MVELEVAKQYLAVDFEDDDLLIKDLIEAGEQTLKRITRAENFKEDEKKMAELYILAFVSQAYHHRELSMNTNESAVNRMFSTILGNLKYRKRDE